MKVSLVYGVFFSMVLAITSCGNGARDEHDGTDKKKLKEPLISANEYLQDTEETLIEDFIERYGWEMKTTSSGLRYMIYVNGSGREAQAGDILKLSYTLRLLNGEIVYSSEIDGPLEFRQGSTDVEKGMNEAVLLLREGDRAKLIIPSHLGYGLPGDQDRIPPRATLIYDIEVLSVR